VTINQNKEESLQKAKDFQSIDLHDDFRAPDTYKDGGFALTDDVVIQKFRTALKNLIAQIGR